MIRYIPKTIACLLIFAASSLAGVVIYDNTANDTLQSINFNSNNLVEAGDQVQFAGTLRTLTNVMIDVFNEGSTDTISDATLTLYNVAGSTLGSEIGAWTLGGQDFVSGDVTTLSFSTNYVVVPDNLVWTLQFSNSSGLDLDVFDPPVVGSSDDTTAWMRTTGGSLTLNTTGTADAPLNFNAEFVASQVPEPSTLPEMGIGWMLVGGLLSRVAKAKSKETA